MQSADRLKRKPSHQSHVTAHLRSISTDASQVGKFVGIERKDDQATVVVVTDISNELARPEQIEPFAVGFGHTSSTRQPISHTESPNARRPILKDRI